MKEKILIDKDLFNLLIIELSLVKEEKKWESSATSINTKNEHYYQEIIDRMIKLSEKEI